MTPAAKPPRLSARERVAQLSDPGSFVEMDPHLRSRDPLRFAYGGRYRDELAAAERKTALLDALVSGRATIAGQAVLLGVFDFSFFGGSMGSVVGEKLRRLFDSGRRERTPVLVVTSSGGARIQEGMVALSMMAKTALAVREMQEAGVPFICLLADPTMGGVWVSFASLADILLAEPGARVGFVGARVHTQALGDAAPAGSAESALAHGLIDAVVGRGEQREVVAQLLADLRPGQPLGGKAGRNGFRPQRRPAWTQVETARRKTRPSGRSLAEATFGRMFEMHGDRVGHDDPCVLTALAKLGEASVVLVAQERHGGNSGHTTPAGFAKAQRAYALAERLGLPVVTMVDTPGAQADEAAEQGGIAYAIAGSLATLSRLRVPVVNVIVGEGGSGGALAFAVGDYSIMLENAVFSVISPEAAASILYRDPSKAAGVAEGLRLTARDLLRLGVVDRVLPEQPALDIDRAPLARGLAAALREELGRLQRLSLAQMLQARSERYGSLGAVSGERWFFWARTLPQAPARALYRLLYRVGEWLG